MSRGARKHAHKYYYGLKVGGDLVWACAFPHCNHYMPKHMEERVIDKLSICWKCGEEFVLESQLMNRQKPICVDCLGFGEIVEEIRRNEDPIMRASQERLNKVTPKNEAEPSPGKGKCRKCGAETSQPEFKLCMPCLMK